MVNINDWDLPQREHGVEIKSHRRRVNVITSSYACWVSSFTKSHRRQFDFITTSCAFWASSLQAWLCHQLGIEHASWPVKIIVNFGFKILLNGISNKIVNTTVSMSLDTYYFKMN